MDIDWLCDPFFKEPNDLTFSINGEEVTLNSQNIYEENGMTFEYMKKDFQRFSKFLKIKGRVKLDVRLTSDKAKGWI